MKKRNLLFLAIFSCISIFLGIKVVKAEEITMYIECIYTHVHGSIELEAHRLRVMYTDLLDYGGNRYQIKARTSAEGKPENIGDITGYFGFDVNHSSDGPATFLTAKASNGGECPTYMTVEYKDKDWNGNKNYKVLFYNSLEESKNCNGEPGTKCKAYFEYYSTANNVKVNPDEDKWVNNTSIDTGDICSDITNVVTVKDKQLHILPTYGRNTKYLQGINWTSSKGIKNVWFTDIISLALHNSFGGAYFDPDTGSGKTSFGLTGETRTNWLDVDLTYCNYTTFQLLRGKSCVTSTDLFHFFNSYHYSMQSIYPNVDEILEFVTYDPDDTGSSDLLERRPYIYAGEDDLAKIQEVMDKVATLPAENEERAKELKANLMSIKDGTHSALDGNSPCQETIDKANEQLTELANLGTEYNAKTALIQEAANSARARAADLGATTEVLEAMDTVLGDLETIIDRNESFIRQVEESLLDAVDLHLRFSASGCGVISDALKEFLNTVLWYIRIAGVVLAIVLSLLDYIKAATGADDKSMEAANKRFMTRVILVAVLFLVPVLLDFLLTTLNISTTAGSISCLN